MSEPIPHFSVTESKIASICPRQFVINKKYGKKVFHGQTSGIGKFIHAVIEQFAKNALNSPRFHQNLETNSDIAIYDLFNKGIHSIFLDMSKTKHIAEWPPEQIERVGKSLEVIAKEMAERYISLKKQNLPKNALKKLFIALEYPFTYIFTIPIAKGSEKIEIAGRIDWLSMDTNNSTMTLWDFKTGPAKNLERELVQIATYSIIVEDLYGIETTAALMYITDTEILEKRIEPINLHQFKPQILKNLLNMKKWLQEKEEVPYTSYIDACEDCIVAQYCITKYGSNPHLENLGIKPVENIAVLEESLEKEVTTEDVELGEVYFTIIPEEVL